MILLFSFHVIPDKTCEITMQADWIELPFFAVYVPLGLRRTDANTEDLAYTNWSEGSIIAHAAWYFVQFHSLFVYILYQWQQKYSASSGMLLPIIDLNQSFTFKANQNAATPINLNFSQSKWLSSFNYGTVMRCSAIARNRFIFICWTYGLVFGCLPFSQWLIMDLVCCSDAQVTNRQ